MKGTKKEDNSNPCASGFSWEMTEVFKHVNIGFFSRDVIANKYIRFTENCARIYGYEMLDFLENPMLWFEVIHPHDKVVAEKEFAVLETGSNSEAEYRIIHRNGTIRWIEVKALPMFENNKLIRVDGIVSDITDRKNAEEQITKSRQLSEIILDAMPGIFYLYNINGKFKYWNKQLLSVTGYRNEDMDSIHPIDLFPPETHTLLSEKIESVFTTGEDDTEALLLTKDGRKIPYFFNGRRVIIDNEVCLAGLGVDISERKKAEDLLLKNEEMLSHILNSIPQAIFWKDTDCRFMGCNTNFIKHTGFSDPYAIVGKDDFDLPCLPEEAQVYRDDDMGVMNSKKPRLHYIEQLRSFSGETFWAETTKIPLKDQNDEVYGILGIFEDITERKQEEERRKKITEDLIQKNIGLTEFSYVVSHNLRAPVSKILGLASLIDTENEPNALNRELINYIVNEVAGIDKVIKDLNQVLSLQNTDNSARLPVSLGEKLQRVLAGFEREIRQTGAMIFSDFNEASEIKTVPAYLYSILNNLLSNAIKYRSPERKLQIHLKTTRTDSFVCLSVKDNGQGIDLEKYGHKMFGLYNRFHADITIGKGVGLTLVKTQIEALGGKIEVESTPDKGTEFKVYFPAE